MTKPKLENRENVRPLAESHKANPLDVLRVTLKSGRSKELDNTLDQRRSRYREQLEEVQAKKEAELSNQQVHIERNQQSLATGDGHTYERITQTYIDITTGTHTTEITVKVKKDDGAPLETTTKYSGEASAVARLCSAKLDGFVQNNYHDVLAQAKQQIEQATTHAKQQIEQEMASRYAELGTMPDPAARANLDSQRDQKIADLDTKRGKRIAEVEKKAGLALRKFLDKHGGRHMDAELLEELQWVQGMDVGDRERRRRIIGSEVKLNTSAKEMQRITAEISDKIQEIKRIIPFSSAAPSENHEFAGSSQTSSYVASHLSHGPLTLENFDKKVEAYMNNRSRGLSDTIYQEISSLATDESKYSESLGSEDKQKIRKALLDIGLKLVERQYKLDEPFEMLEKWERYTANHYGKRLMYERRLVDHLGEMAKAASEHSAAVHNERELIELVNTYYKAGLRKVDHHPTYSDAVFTNIHSQARSILGELISGNIDQEKRTALVNNLIDISKKAPDIFQGNDSQQLQSALYELEQAHLHSIETKGKYERAQVQKEKLLKLVELEKGRDDANDALDLNSVNAIKETDKTSLQHLRSLELEMVKHFYARKLENHKALNKEEDEIQHFLMNLDRIEIGDQVQQKRIKAMYWLALFGSGDQAALMALGRTSNTEFSAFMRLFS